MLPDASLKLPRERLPENEANVEESSQGLGIAGLSPDDNS